MFVDIPSVDPIRLSMMLLLGLKKERGKQHFMPFGREGENLYVWYLGFKLT